MAASSKKDLWIRIRDYHFDNLVPPHLVDHVAETFGGPNASTRAFASKVAKKTGWDLSFALRAVEEYKKFVFLGVTADFFVTPPKIIDRVWHEHLLFTRSYREFCRTVLRHDFDHHPELVPTGDQTAVFQAQYEATLERYEAEFNMAPPAVIWGTPKFKSRRVDKTAKMKSKEVPAGDGGDSPLHTYFESDSSEGGFFSGFGGGGGFAGAGAERSWDDSSSHDSSDGGDAGAGDSGGSGCSSGCGGGGCGGD